MSENVKFSKEVFASQVVEDSSKLDGVRQQISDWANGLRFHPLKDLGSLIELETVTEQPLYHITLQTQYEKRTKDMGSAKPHRDQKEADDPVSLEALDVWECAIEHRKDFTNGDKTVDIEESRTVEDCQTCDASGKMDCPECHTEGEVACKTCEGRGQVNCSDCDGGGGEMPQMRHRHTQFWLRPRELSLLQTSPLL